MKKDKFILLLIILIFFACQQENGKSKAMDTKPSSKVSTNEAEKENKEEIFFSIVGNLRLREIPDVEGDIVGMMKYGQKAVYLNEESKFKEKIKLRGKTRYDSWKKVKIKDANSGKEIEGWVYGGGLIKESEIYSEKSSNEYERKIIRATHEELSEILDIEIEDEFFFDGIVKYKKSESGDFIKDGKFNVRGTIDVEISKNFEFPVSVEITGNYDEDKPDGIFERQMSGYENGNITTINYENGKCLWSSFMGSGEGEDYNHREENPKDCSFRYIQDRLGEVNGWN